MYAWDEIPAGDRYLFFLAISDEESRRAMPSTDNVQSEITAITMIYVVELFLRVEKGVLCTQFFMVVGLWVSALLIYNKKEFTFYSRVRSQHAFSKTSSPTSYDWHCQSWGLSNSYSVFS